MSIKSGDRVPDVDLYMMAPEGPKAVNMSEFCRGRTVVLFAVPGAYTPTCSERQLPGLVARADELLCAGGDAIACVSVNDVFVMHAWGHENDATQIAMLADGMGEFAGATGMTVDFSARGMGVRSDRYAMIIDDGEIRWVAREQPKTLEVSTAEAVLAALG